MSTWIDVCSETDIDEEDLIIFKHNGVHYAIYNTPKGFFATNAMCTHEKQSLEEGIVIDCIIECPLHGGRFDICTGKALTAPVYLDLQTYPVKNENGRLLIKLV